jgi:hypothetical protein
LNYNSTAINVWNYPQVFNPRNGTLKVLLLTNESQTYIRVEETMEDMQPGELSPIRIAQGIQMAKKTHLECIAKGRRVV